MPIRSHVKATLERPARRAISDGVHARSGEERDAGALKVMWPQRRQPRGVRSEAFSR